MVEGKLFFKLKDVGMDLSKTFFSQKKVNKK